MNTTIKMVLHCGKRAIELDERTLYETGALHTLAHHFETSVDQSKPRHPYWLDVFSGLAELAHDKSCEYAVDGDQFLEHIQRLNNGGRDPYSVAQQRAAGEPLRQKLERTHTEFISEEQEQLELEG